MTQQSVVMLKTHTWLRLWKPSVAVTFGAAILVVALYATYRVIDPLPPRHFTIAAGIPGTTYDEFARQYARIFARHGVDLEVRNYPSAVEHFDALRDPGSGVRAAFTNFGFTQPNDAAMLYSLGGISDTPVYIFYTAAEPVTRLGQFRGKRLSIGMPRTALRTLMLEVLKATGALEDSIALSDLDYAAAIDALIDGQIDVAMIPTQVEDSLLQRALSNPSVRLMSVAQAEAIAKTVPGLRHVVLWRGLISLTHDIPNWDIDLLALRNRLLVRKDLHPALQYLLLEAMREVHGGAGPFNRLGEFPADQSNDLPLSPTAQAFYRSGPTFWLTSLLGRIVFFVIPVAAALISVIGFALPFYSWLHTRRIAQLHRALGNLERELVRCPDESRFLEHQRRIAEIGHAVRSHKVARAFEVDLHRLGIHLRMVEEEVDRKYRKFMSRQ